MTAPHTNWTPWGNVPADQNVIPFPRANLDRTPCDRGVNGLVVMAEIKRQKLQDAARNRDLARFADLRDGGNLFDYSDDGPGALFMMIVCLVITVAAIGALMLVVW
jgi:hypothetical protein